MMLLGVDKHHLVLRFAPKGRSPLSHTGGQPSHLFVVRRCLAYDSLWVPHSADSNLHRLRCQDKEHP